MRKLALLLTIGFFLSATSANACDGGKTSARHHKGKASAACASATCMKAKTCTDASCMKDGKCTKPTSSKAAKSGCMKASAAGTHHCCMDKADKS
jgi:hypothetical protein